MPGLQEEADWRRNWMMSGDVCLAATIRMVSPLSRRRLKSLGPWVRGRGGGGEGEGEGEAEGLTSGSQWREYTHTHCQ